MKPSRRRALGTLTGIAGLAAAERIADHYGLVPPDAGGPWGPGATLTYASQRILTAHQPLAREFPRTAISADFPVNGDPPNTHEYQRHLAFKFETWKLSVSGLVARPGEYTLEQIRALKPSTQTTLHACEEGWSYIAEWTGTTVATFLDMVDMKPEARFVVFYPFDTNWDSLDMADALHPQTMLAWGMNGKDLPTEHGAPLRLRVARQLGYKSVKYLSRIVVTDSLEGIGNGLGSVSPDLGYSWFAGI